MDNKKKLNDIFTKSFMLSKNKEEITIEKITDYLN